MVDLYRISAPEYIHDLSGTGAKLFGGRWNEKGTPLLYTSQNVSLAILEILVHFDGLTIPPQLSLLHLKIPEESIQEFPLKEFQKIQSKADAEYRFKEAGEKWIKSLSSLALRVPSIITALEYNFLINPRQPEYETLEITSAEELKMDSRLFS